MNLNAFLTNWANPTQRRQLRFLFVKLFIIRTIVFLQQVKRFC